MQNTAAPVTSLPENFAASQFIITVGPREIGLILGQTRHFIDNQSHTAPSTEWHASYSISPIMAKQMHSALSQCLEMYEQQFGTIPRDPKSKIETIDPIPV